MCTVLGDSFFHRSGGSSEGGIPPAANEFLRVIPIVTTIHRATNTEVVIGVAFVGL
jgi:hypothetical protein